MNLFVYFLLLYCYHFFSLGRVILPRDEKTATFTCQNFSYFFFFTKIMSQNESSAHKNRNANLSSHVIPARVIHKTIVAGLRSAMRTCKSCDCCGTCHSQRLKPNPENSLPPRDECQVRQAIRDMYREICKRVHMNMKSLPFSRLRIQKFLNSAFLKIV